MYSLTTSAGVAAIVTDSRAHILLHRRIVGDGWAPPSGSVRTTESVEDALRRVLQVETGLEVAIDRLIGVYSDPSLQIVRYPDTRHVHYVTTVVLCHAVAGRLHGTDEGGMWQWFSPRHLPEPMLSYARQWVLDAFEISEALLR